MKNILSSGAEARQHLEHESNLIFLCEFTVILSWFELIDTESLCSGGFMVLMPWAKLWFIRVQSMTNTVDIRKDGARI